MQLNSKKELRYQRVAQALKNNLKKRKIFQRKINKEKKETKKFLMGYLLSDTMLGFQMSLKFLLMWIQLLLIQKILKAIALFREKEKSV